jgi:hypothetical protein
MHNFATTRGQLWERIQLWGDGVAAMADATGGTPG